MGTDAEGRIDLSLEIAPTADLDAAARAQIVALCTRAFDQDFSPLFDLVVASWHVLAKAGGVLVAHACWSTRWIEPEGLRPLRTAYVDAVATEPALQRRGLGRTVLERFAGEAAGYELNALASDHAVGFYERLGWQRWLGPTAVRLADGLAATPGENVLVLRTATTPALDLSGRLIAHYRPGQPW